MHLKYSFLADETMIEAGCDEAGRGPLAGPVVAAVVIFPLHYKIAQLDDSKKLTSRTRERLVPLIKQHSLAWAIGSATPAEIDQMNILQATFCAMHRAINQLEKQRTPHLLLIDGNRFKPYPAIAHKCIIKGDQKYASIAAASVLAKVHRDQLMKELALQYPNYGWEKNKGYPTLRHRTALQAFGATPHHRQSFKCVGSVKL